MGERDIAGFVGALVNIGTSAADIVLRRKAQQQDFAARAQRQAYAQQQQTEAARLASMHMHKSVPWLAVLGVGVSGAIITGLILSQKKEK